MIKQGWVWYLVLGIFYLGLIFIAFSFYNRSENIRLLNTEEDIEASFEGNDWETWESKSDFTARLAIHCRTTLTSCELPAIVPTWWL